MNAASRQLEAFIDHLGLRHFRGEELTPYWSRKKGKISNSPPPPALWPNIVHTLIVLDEIRAMAKAPILITSSYRNPAYNAAVGGERNSYHMRFNAVDFYADGKSPAALWKIATNLRGMPFAIDNETFIFRGGIGLYAGFVHLDTRGYDADWRR